MPLLVEQQELQRHMKDYLVSIVQFVPIYDFINKQCIAIAITCLGLLIIDVMVSGKTKLTLAVNKIWITCVAVLAIIIYPIVNKLANLIWVTYATFQPKLPHEDNYVYNRPPDGMVDISSSESKSSEEFRTLSVHCSSNSLKTLRDDYEDFESGIYTWNTESYSAAVDQESDSHPINWRITAAIHGSSEMNSYEKVLNWNCLQGRI